VVYSEESLKEYFSKTETAVQQEKLQRYYAQRDVGPLGDNLTTGMAK
jgi:hypothetical protein